VDRPQKSLVVTGVLIALITGTLAVIYAMFVNALGVYFVIEGTPVVTTVAVVTYRVLTGVAIALPVAGVILGILRRRIVFVITHILLVVVVLVAAFILAVPSYAAPPPHHQPLPSNYVPCYSGSNDCRDG
jgi:Family of unknown function (DUF6234)